MEVKIGRRYRPKTLLALLSTAIYNLTLKARAALLTKPGLTRSAEQSFSC